MKPQNLFELACASLPVDVSVAELKAATLDKWWNEKPNLAIAHALRKCPRINWEAYLECNPDIKESEVDPVLHFLRHGIFEGRKLQSHSLLADTEKACDACGPDVSVIVTNSDNELYLEKCIASVTGQTLKDIEIVIVDDASSDGSAAIIQNLAATDERIKYVHFDKKQGLHISRMAGVKIASGRYIMFLNSSDYYLPNACEVAFNWAIHGYDIVNFATNVMYTWLAEPHIMQKNYSELTELREEEFVTYEIMDKLFHHKNLSCSLDNKIFLSGLCKKAFAKMQPCHTNRSADQYEMLVLASSARNLKTIGDRVYCLRYGVGTSSAVPTLSDLLQEGNVIAGIEAYALRNNTYSYAKKIKQIVLDETLSQFMDNDFDADIDKFFERLISQYGALFIAQRFMHKYYEQWGKVAKKFCRYMPEIKTNPRKIGIHCANLTCGRTQTDLENLLYALRQAGYEVEIFIENRSDDKIVPGIDAPVHKIHAGTFDVNDDDKGHLESHLKDLFEKIQALQIDAMYFMGSNAVNFLWDIILLHCMRKPVIASMTTEPIWYFTRRNRYSARDSLQVLSCVDKLITLSRYGELYFRSNYVNADYVPNGVKDKFFEGPINYDATNLVFVGRICDFDQKHTLDALRILFTVLTEFPGVHMTFVGDCGDSQSENMRRLYELGSELNILENIHVTGWVDDPAPLLRQAGIMIVTSNRESFSNVIVEAQACGLPVVTYDLPIEPINDNEAIITVPQGDYEAAAKQVIALLKDKSRRNQLQDIARERARRFSMASYVRNVTQLLKNFAVSCPLSHYTSHQYQEMLRWLAAYEL